MSTKETIAEDLNERFIPDLRIDLICPDPNNPRKFFDKAALEELAASIQAHGIVQPIVVRPISAVKTKTGPQFMIVAGERRYRAAKLASLTNLPSVVRHYSEEQAAEVQQIENLQRADVHPLDEAHGFTRLVKEFKYTVESIAEKIGKSPTYVARRMKLVDLIPRLQELLWKKELPLGHAEFLCRFSEHDQKVFYKNDDENEIFGWGGEPVSMRELIRTTENTFLLSLDAAPWKKDTPGPGSAPACNGCPQRSGNAKFLFPELAKEPNVCTNRDCFNLKMETFIADKLLEDKSLLLLSDRWNEKEKGVLAQGQYHKIHDKKDRCSSVVQGIYQDGRQSGHIVPICIDKKCKKHHGQIYRDSGMRSRSQQDEERARRIDNACRQVVYGELWKAKVSSVVIDLRTVAQSVYDRSYDRNAAAKAMGFEKSKTQYSSSPEPAVKKFIKEASQKDLSKFIVLLLNASYLASYGGKEETLRALKAATAGWGVDIDKVYAAERKKLQEKSKKKAVKK